jgi:GT2 family glycosyltransferase
MDGSGRVLAAIVTFHPDPEGLPSVFAAALREVDQLAVVDNQASEASRSAIAAAIAASGAGAAARVTVRENALNEGVAVAFNQAIAAGPAERFEFVFLLDQDSVVRPGAVARLIREYRALTERFRVGALQASNLEANGRVPLDSRRRDFHRRRGRYAGPTSYEGRLFLNSGTLVPTQVFLGVGAFDERYFVDFVDYEFSLRLARRGYGVFHVPEAAIEHNFVRGSVRSRVRLYYAIRELWRLIRTYGRQFPDGVAPVVWTTMNRLASVTLRSGEPVATLSLAMAASFDSWQGVTGEYRARGARD